MMHSRNKLLQLVFLVIWTSGSQAAPTSEVVDVAAAQSSPTAKTKNGTFVGRHMPEYNQDFFLGLPYAQQLMGVLRFRTRQSLNGSFTGKQMATDYSPSCVGYGSDQWGYPISEDCLYLNVIRPTGTKANSALPVALWIHFVPVPIIYGTNTDEGTSFGPLGDNTVADFVQGLENATITPRVNLQPDVVQTILNAYPDDPCIGIPTTLGCTRPGLPYGAEYRRTSAYAGDVNQAGPRRFTCETWAKAGGIAYCYRYNGWTNGLTAFTGVNHFQEVALVFDNTLGVGYDAAPDPFANRGAAFHALAKLMSCSWASFVASLDPNKFRETNTNVPLWPVYNVGNPKIIVWESNVTTHLEVDSYRADAISTILSLNAAFHR